MHRLLWLSVFPAALSLGATPIDYARELRPLLEAKCKTCHGGDKRSGGFTIRDYEEMLHGGRSGPSVMPGDPSSSLLLQRITGERGPAMPLGGTPLSASEIALVRTWIEQGARLTPDGPAAKAPWIPTLALRAPKIESPRPVDQLLQQYFAKHHITPPGPVSDAAFARRVYLDVWGLLPSPEDLTAFCDDRYPAKRDKLIERLLAGNDNYTEHWISFWNDLLRNDGGDSYHGGRKSITDWLYRALDKNEPYDRFVSELLNPRGKEGPDGFLLGVNWRGDVNASQTPIMQAAQNSAQVFLGINLKCNSCHDSFISRWKLKDAYGLAAFFSDAKKLELVRCDNPTRQYATASFLYPELNHGEVPETLPARRMLAARLFTAAGNGRTPRTLVNRYWLKLMGRGLVADPDDLDAEPWSPELLDWLAADFVEHGYDLKHLLRVILRSQAYAMPAVKHEGKDEREYRFCGPEIRRITAEQFVDALGTITGEWETGPIPGAKAVRFVRDWQVQSTSLSRALGRPIRDQVFTTRDSSATTLQELELVNGWLLARRISSGAARMQGHEKIPPKNLYDSGSVGSKHQTFEIDVSQVEELHLVTADTGSYSPERVTALWADAQVLKDGQWIWLDPQANQPAQMKGAEFPAAIRAEAPSEKVYDLHGRGYKRFRGVVGVDEKSLASDISPSVRFFIFSEKPDTEGMVQREPGVPVPAMRVPNDPNQLIRQLWLQALGREPNPAERILAQKALAQPAGLADLLWSLLMLPEFQLIL